MRTLQRTEEIERASAVMWLFGKLPRLKLKESFFDDDSIVPLTSRISAPYPKSGIWRTYIHGLATMYRALCEAPTLTPECQGGLRRWRSVQGLRPCASSAQAPYAQRFLSIRQMSKATGISEYLIRRLVKQGKLPAFYSGNKALLNYTKVCEILGVMSD